MKSVLIIGLGRFGHHLCIDMANRGNEVMVIDKDEKKTPDLLEYATAVRVGDCTNEEVLRSLGVGNFDLCFVCIGSNFQSSLEITSLVKELGAKHVVSKANRDIHAKFLLRNGADEVFYPDRDIAERLAVKYSAAMIHHFSQYFIQFIRFRCGVADLLLPGVIADFNGSDQTTLLTSCGEHFPDHPGSGSLAFCSRNTDDF